MVSDAIPVAADVTGQTGSVMTEGMAPAVTATDLASYGAARSRGCDGGLNTAKELVLVLWESKAEDP